MDSLYLDRNLVLESTCGLEDADYVLLGAPFDSTSTYRPGSRFAPLEVRREFLELDKEAGGRSVYDLKFHDLGNVAVVPGNAAETVRRVGEVVAGVLEANSGASLITLGGEHLMTYPVVKSLGGKVEVVLQFDAHADLREDYMGESLSHGCVGRRIAELGTTLTQYGVRSTTTEEDEYIKENRILSLNPREDFSRILKAVKGRETYITVDMDVLDPKETSGVGNPQPGGLSFNTLESNIIKAKRGCRVAGFDIMEASPIYDRTASLYAAKLLSAYMTG